MTLATKCTKPVRERRTAPWGRVSVLCLALFIAGCSASPEKTDFQVKKQPDIQQVKPQKPVKIKLHRNAKGEYSWDLSGDNVDEVVNADSKLKKLLKIP
jgi:hypothetical protein